MLSCSGLSLTPAESSPSMTLGVHCTQVLSIHFLFGSFQGSGEPRPWGGRPHCPSPSATHRLLFSVYKHPLSPQNRQDTHRQSSLEYCSSSHFSSYTPCLLVSIHLYLKQKHSFSINGYKHTYTPKKFAHSQFIHQ